MKRLALLTVIILLTLLLMMVLWQLRSVVLMFILALAIAAALDEPIDNLAERGWSRGIAVLTVYIAVFGGLAILFALVVLPAIRELDPMVQELLIQYGSIQSGFGDVTGPRRAFVVSRLPTTEQLATWLASEDGGGMAQSALNVTGYLANGLGQAALAIVIAVYWTADQTRFERLWLSLLPPERRTRARNFLHKLQKDVGAYLRSEMAQSVLAGALLAVGYFVLKVEYPFLLSLLAALSWFVPLIGGLFAVLLAGIIGGLAGWWVAVGAVLYTIAVLAVLEFWVEPRLYTHDRYWGVLVILVMLALGDAFGLFGLLVAPPVAVALQIALNDLLERPSTPQPEQPEPPELIKLRDRLAGLQARVRQSQTDGDPSPRLVNLVERLETLLAQVEETERKSVEVGGRD